MIFDYVTINGVVAFLGLSERFVNCSVRKSARKHFPRNVLNSYQECMWLKWFLLVSEFWRVRQIEIRFLKGSRIIILVLNWSGVSDNRRFEKLVVKIAVTDRSKSKGKRPLVLKIGSFEKSMIPIHFLPDVFYYFQWKPGVLCTEWLTGG